MPTKSSDRTPGDDTLEVSLSRDGVELTYGILAVGLQGLTGDDRRTASLVMHTLRAALGGHHIPQWAKRERAEA